MTPDNSDPQLLELRANLNQSRFPQAFLHTFTVILPSITRSTFLFSFRSFLYNFILENSNHVFSAREVGENKRCTKSEILNLFQNNRVDSLSLLLLSLQLKLSVHPYIEQALLLNINHILLPLKWRVHDSCIPSPSICFLVYRYLLWTPDNSNIFSISLEGSSYRESTVISVKRGSNQFQLDLFEALATYIGFSSGLRANQWETQPFLLLKTV